MSGKENRDINQDGCLSMMISEVIVLVDGDNENHHQDDYVCAQLKCLQRYASDPSFNRKIQVIWYAFNSSRYHLIASLLEYSPLKHQVIVELLDCDNDVAVDDCFREDVGSAIRYGMHFEYGIALEMQVPDTLAKLPVWYFAVIPNKEFINNKHNQGIAEAVSRVMPISHQQKAITWISLIECIRSAVRLPWLTALNVNIYELIGVVRLLHDFECVSENVVGEFDMRLMLDALRLIPEDLFVDEASNPFGMIDENSLEDGCSWGCYEKRLGELVSSAASECSRVKASFPTAESLMYTLWYSSRTVFTMPFSEKYEVLFSDGGGIDTDLMDRVSAYDIVKILY